MTVPYDISIIIPTSGDEAALAALLKRIRGWPRRPREVIVADGAASPVTRNTCEHQGAQWIASVPGRSVQLSKGAQQARGSILWFLHVDSAPRAEALDAVIEAIDGGAVGGYFRFRFGGVRGWYKALLEAAIARRSRWGAPEAEQGLFASREAFDVCGGFAPMPLFEAVPLVKGLRHQGRFAPLEMSIEVSERRWQREGWIRRPLVNRLLALGYLLGISSARLARWHDTLRPGSPAPDT